MKATLNGFPFLLANVLCTDFHECESKSNGKSVMSFAGSALSAHIAMNSMAAGTRIKRGVPTNSPRILSVFHFHAMRTIKTTTPSVRTSAYPFRWRSQI